MYRMFAFLLLAIFVGVPATGRAHEIKVFVSQPAPAAAGTKVTIYLGWGHRMPVDDLVDAGGIESFDLHAPDGTKSALKVEGLSLQANAAVLKGEGVYRAAVTRKRGVHTFVIDKDGERTFKRGGKSGVTEGTIVVGKPSAEPMKALGMAIEIVPVDAPARWKANADLAFRVLVDGKPLADADLVAAPGFQAGNRLELRDGNERERDCERAGGSRGNVGLEGE